MRAAGSQAATWAACCRKSSSQSARCRSENFSSWLKTRSAACMSTNDAVASATRKVYGGSIPRMGPGAGELARGMSPGRKLGSKQCKLRAARTSSVSCACSVSRRACARGARVAVSGCEAGAPPGAALPASPLGSSLTKASVRCWPATSGAASGAAGPGALRMRLRFGRTGNGSQGVACEGLGPSGAGSGCCAGTEGERRVAMRREFTEVESVADEEASIARWARAVEV